MASVMILIGDEPPPFSKLPRGALDWNVNPGVQTERGREEMTRNRVCTDPPNGSFFRGPSR